MEQLDDILQQATAAIGHEYFLLPIHGADPVHRERVCCYELYHQMRLRWPPPEHCAYRLNGEIDKSPGTIGLVGIDHLPRVFTM